MKIFHYRFSEAMKALKLKLGTHSRLLYRLYQNQGQGPVTLELHPLIGFTNLH